MRITRRSSIALIAGAPAVLQLSSCTSSQAPPPAPADAGARAMARFDDQKFGLFIHWGLYAIPAGVWKGKYVRGIGEWIMFRERIPVAEYAQLASQFNPVKFSGEEWAQLAHDAGMKYLVITSKHHDGFAMFKSEASKYNIVDATPYAKDPMADLSAACKKRNIGFGFYYSQDQDWHEAGGRGNDWDFPKERDAQPYLEGKVFPQVREILSNYGELELIWFDTPGLLSVEQVTELRDLVKQKQPNCLLNSRIGHNKGDYVQTGDNAIPIQVYTHEGKWEVPATLNDTWGFKANDTNWKDPRDLIGKLVDIVSKGGNYLLNVGPTAEGLIPEASQRILRAMGQWLAVNGEAVYETDASPFWFPDITWRATVKPGKVYLHLLNWPGASFRFEGLASPVTKAYLLANKAEVPYRKEGEALVFTLPAEPLDINDTVLVLEIADQQAKVMPGFGARELPNRLDLHAWIARLRGEEIRYDFASMSASNFRKFERETNELYWYNFGALNGNYSVEIEYACDNAAAGSTLRISTGPRNNANESKVEAKVEGTGGAFAVRKLDGSIALGEGHSVISLGLPDDDKSASMRMRKITLTKA
jgi:alpha-L-fucosidase